MDENSTTSLAGDGISWSLPTAAILIIAMGGYIALIIAALLIRKCLISQGICADCCPKVLKYDCCSCFTNCVQSCDCQVPTVDGCLDIICPARQRLNCVEFFVCEWASFHWCQEGTTFTCGSGDCTCTCEAPQCESINCLCCEISFRTISPSQ